MLSNTTFSKGDLAIIHDEKTNDFVNAIAYGARIWIGAHRVGPALHENNQLSWIDGTPLDYSKWAPNSNFQNPDNWEGSEFCVFSYGYSWTWNDYDCYSKSTYQIKNILTHTLSEKRLSYFNIYMYLLFLKSNAY